MQEFLGVISASIHLLSFSLQPIQRWLKELFWRLNWRGCFVQPHNAQYNFNTTRSAPSCTSSEELGKRKEEEDKKGICEVPVNPTSFSRLCGWTWLKDLIKDRRKRSKKRWEKHKWKNISEELHCLHYFFFFLRKLLLRYFPLAENLLNFRSCICHTRHPVITGSSTVLLFWAQPDCSMYKNSSIFHIANWNCQERECCKHMHRGLLLGWGEMIKLSYSSVPNHWSFGVGSLSLTRNPAITSMPTLRTPLLLLLLVRIISSGEVG